MSRCLRRTARCGGASRGPINAGRRCERSGNERAVSERLGPLAEDNAAFHRQIHQHLWRERFRIISIEGFPRPSWNILGLKTAVSAEHVGKGAAELADVIMNRIDREFCANTRCELVQRVSRKNPLVVDVFPAGHGLSEYLRFQRAADLAYELQTTSGLVPPFGFPPDVLADEPQDRVTAFKRLKKGGCTAWSQDFESPLNKDRWVSQVVEDCRANDQIRTVRCYEILMSIHGNRDATVLKVAGYEQPIKNSEKIRAYVGCDHLCIGEEVKQRECAVSESAAKLDDGRRFPQASPGHHLFNQRAPINKVLILRIIGLRISQELGIHALAPDADFRGGRDDASEVSVFHLPEADEGNF